MVEGLYGFLVENVKIRRVTQHYQRIKKSTHFCFSSFSFSQPLDFIMRSVFLLASIYLVSAAKLERRSNSLRREPIVYKDGLVWKKKNW